MSTCGASPRRPNCPRTGCHAAAERPGPACGPVPAPRSGWSRPLAWPRPASRRRQAHEPAAPQWPRPVHRQVPVLASPSQCGAMGAHGHHPEQVNWPQRHAATIGRPTNSCRQGSPKQGDPCSPPPHYSVRARLGAAAHSRRREERHGSFRRGRSFLPRVWFAWLPSMTFTCGRLGMVQGPTPGSRTGG
jgi:hypothetical protein